jgi:molybdate transport system substrate-binding protein
MSVKQGAAKPDISTVEALKKALVNARSLAYSDSASGVYISTQMFKSMGIEAEMRIRAHRVYAAIEDSGLEPASKK